MRSTISWAALVLLLGGTGCAPADSAPTGPAGIAEARAVTSGVELRNTTERPIYFAAFEREFATRARFAPCADVERCPTVAPGATRTIPLAEVTGYHGGATAVIVYYWHLTPVEGGYAVENMSSRVLPIRS